jgi:hypothetical protein
LIDWLTDNRAYIDSVAIALVLGFAIDVWLVETGRKTISWSTWVIVNAHPIVIVLIVVVFGFLSWTVRDCWLESALLAGIGLHLVTADSAAVMTTAKRWTLRR